MAEKRVCAAPDCSNSNRITAGYCSLHYQRLRRLGRLEGLQKPMAIRGEPQRFIGTAVNHVGDECLIWPYAKDQDGRGRVRLGGRWRVVSQIVCERIHGPRPTPLHEAAHSCGRGHEACCSGRHIRWATHQENEADKIAHGTSQHGDRNHMAKLSAVDVAEVRRLASSMSQRKIAERFGISQSAVSMIQTGRRWS